MSQVNQYNFLRWSDFEISTEQPEIPRAYVRDRGACPYMPIAFPTEAFGFYINTLTGFDFADLDIADFTNLRLDIVNSVSGASTNNIAPLQKHDLGGDRFNIFATGVYPTLSNGQYYFQITKSAGNIPVLFSNNVYVRNDKANLDQETVFVRFKHDRFFYNIQYHELPGFYQQFRLHLNLQETQLDSDKELYKEVTTGKQRTFQNYLNRYRKIEAYYFDKKAHEAAGIMFEHSFLELNGKLYTAKTVYKDNEEPLSTYSKAEIEVWDEEFGSVNRC